MGILYNTSNALISEFSSAAPEVLSTLRGILAGYEHVEDESNLKKNLRKFLIEQDKADKFTFSNEPTELLCRRIAEQIADAHESIVSLLMPTLDLNIQYGDGVNIKKFTEEESDNKKRLKDLTQFILSDDRKRIISCEQSCKAVINVPREINAFNELIEFADQTYPCALTLTDTEKNRLIRWNALLVNECIKYSTDDSLARCYAFDTLKTPLFVASLFDYIEIVKFLLADVTTDVNKGELHETDDDQAWTPLHAACRNGHTRIVRVLLACESIDINRKSALGEKKSAIHIACGHRQSNVEIVSMLLDHSNLDIVRGGNTSRSLLIEALGGEESYCNYYDRFEVLLKHKKIQLSSEDLVYVIEHAYIHAYKEACLLLWDYKKIDLPEKTQRSMLIGACKTKNEEMFKLLLEKYPDIDVNLVLNKAVTPHVDSRGNSNGIDFLLKKINKGERTLTTVLDAVNQFSGSGQDLCAKIFINKIKWLPLPELIQLSKIMRSIQEDNIVSDHMTMPDGTIVCIKNLVFFRQETGFFSITWTHGNTDFWQEVMGALKQQLHFNLQAVAAHKHFPSGQVLREYPTCLDFLNLHYQRGPRLPWSVDTTTESKEWLAGKLKLNVTK